MTFKKILYWSHLICGVVAGLVILMMSITGVIITYDLQLNEWALKSDYNSPSANQQRLAMEKLINIAKTHKPDKSPKSIRYRNDSDAPVRVSFGKTDSLYINSYTGVILGEGNNATKRFFRLTTQIHRWFALTGEERATGRAITAAANLMFLFIILSGIYLWFPKVLRWSYIKKVLLFHKTKNAKARDYNWHHVIGIWTAIPLAILVATATYFYYSWARDLIYFIADDNPSKSTMAISKLQDPQLNTSKRPLPLNELLTTASEQLDSWNIITITLPKPNSKSIDIRIDQGSGRRPQKQVDVSYDRIDGSVINISTFAERSARSKASSIVRYLHTGEILGFWGQTIAGFVSMTSTILVWTGIALAYRRYISPVWKKRKTKTIYQT